MGTINVSLPSDGTTADVSDYNTPINTIVTEINGNLDNANVKTGAAIATAKLATDAGIVTGMLADAAVTPAKLIAGAGTTWPWQTWTSPIASGVTTTSGTTNYALYQQTGKRVRCRLGFTFGASSAITAAVILTLPVASVSTYTASASALGLATLLDSGTAFINGRVVWKTTTTVEVTATKADGVYSFDATLTSTVPMTWTTNDGFYVDFEYEAA